RAPWLGVLAAWAKLAQNLRGGSERWPTRPPPLIERRNEVPMKIRVSMLAAALAGTAAFAPAAGADDIADFYRGKQITIIIGTAAGGGYGMVTQVAQRYVMKH